MRLRTLVMAVVVMVMASTQGLALDDQIREAIGELERQISLIDSIKAFVERPDLPRLFLLRSTSKRVLESLQDPQRGPLHQATTVEYQHLYITYRYSKAFFEEIKTERTKGAIDELASIAEHIAKTHGFDETPYTLTTMSTFSQMHKLVLQLLKLNIEPELRTKLDNLKVPLGQMIAKARGGDNYPTYQAAIPICQQLRTLYPYFYKIASSHAAFEITLEIQGLNEWYVDRAKIESELAKP